MLRRLRPLRFAQSPFSKDYRILLVAENGTHRMPTHFLGQCPLLLHLSGAQGPGPAGRANAEATQIPDDVGASVGKAGEFTRTQSSGCERSLGGSVGRAP